MTYDDRALLAAFHDQQGLNFPLLQDENVKHVDAYGVRNQDYEPGDAGYGIPYPGILYIGRNGTILAKFALPGYRRRPPFPEVLAAVRAVQGAD